MNALKSMISWSRGRQQGFTLIEMLIVIGILGVVAAVVTINLVSLADAGKEEGWDTDKSQLGTAVSLHLNENDGATNPYPTSTAWDVSLNLGVVDETLGTGDGTRTVFGPVRLENIDGTYFRDLSVPAGIGPEDVVVNVDGTDVANDETVYTIDSATGEITFLAPVTNGHEILIDYSYGGCYIDMQLLVTDGYLDKVPASSSSDNGGSGRWSWYIDENGLLNAHLCGDPSCIGYQEGDPYP